MNNSRPRLGVALSGGGVRGLAHLGVLKALEEEGIAVDLIAGTSMGGAVAALYAAGVPLERLIEETTRTRLLDVAALDKSWYGLFGHKKVARFLSNLLGDATLTFEQLDIPAVVMAVDLETGELVTLDEGPIIPAVMATTALPLLFAPVRHEGRWLIDGGALNNLPVDVVRRMGAERVLAVNVPPSIKMDMPPFDGADSLTERGRLPLPRHIRTWRTPLLIAEISLGFALQEMNRARLQAYPPDLLLQVELPNMGILATDRSEEAVRAGYEVARQHMDELLALQEPLAMPA